MGTTGPEKALAPRHNLNSSTRNREVALAQFLTIQRGQQESEQAKGVQLHGQEPSLKDKRQ